MTPGDGQQTCEFTLSKGAIGKIGSLSIKLMADESEAMSANYLFIDDPAAALGVEKTYDPAAILEAGKIPVLGSRRFTTQATPARA